MNIIVTGASSGIGFELVKLFCQDKDHQVMAIARNEEKLHHLNSLCIHGNMFAVPFDITETDMSGLAPVITSIFNQVDIVINNAGVLINNPFIALRQEDWQQIFEVNVFGVARFLQLLYPLLNREGSHVVNIGSMGGFMGSSKFPGLAAYSSAKAALAVLSECLAEEWKLEGIKVNCLALGAVQTEMLATAFPDYQAPLQAEEIAQWIAHFALNGHRYFNGKVIPVSLDTP